MYSGLEASTEEQVYGAGGCLRMWNSSFQDSILVKQKTSQLSVLEFYHVSYIFWVHVYIVELFFLLND